MSHLSPTQIVWEAAGRPAVAGCEVSLSQGMVAIVDPCDIDFVAQWRWFYFSGSNRSLTGYAVRNRRVGDPGHKGVVYMHRELMGAAKGLVVDHINGNGLDNRRVNLRIATHRQNCRNRRGAERNSTSEYLGVSWHKRAHKWAAFICERRNRRCVSTYLGVFNSEAEAARAYDAEALLRFGRFASLNFKP
jgi:hypothetical protein